MSSNLASPTGSLIGKLPYDVLREIFIRCLPRYPLDYCIQPNPRIAPMLLCHVCSSWRTDAFASATLWSHLVLRIQPISTIRTEFGSWALLRRQVEFIQWWQKNQGPIHPFLRLHFKFPVTMDKRYQHLLTGDGMNILLKYVNSAQYLRLDNGSFWDRIHEGIILKRGVSLIWPHLHTLARDESGKSFFLVQALIDNTLAHAPLRHLSMHFDEVPDSFKVPLRWLTLTHISLSEIQLPLTFWFSLIRAVPELQWGYFYLALVSGEEDWPKPTQCTLHHLSTIFFSMGGVVDDLGDPEINIFFTNLYLPNLRTLSLASYDSSWCDEYAIPDLWTVLRSTPAITTLSLRFRFLSLEKGEYSTEILPMIEPQEPVWSHAPLLVHLQLELPEANDDGIDPEIEEELLDNFVRNALFSDNNWLNLTNPACPIRTITFNDASGLNSQFGRKKDFIMSCILKYADKIPNITFHITSESGSQLSSRLGREFGARNIGA